MKRKFKIRIIRMGSKKEDMEILRRTIRRHESVIQNQDSEINDLSSELALARNEYLRLKEFNDQLLQDLEERDFLREKNNQLKDTIQEMKLHLGYYLEENQKQKQSVEEWSHRSSEQETLIVKMQQEIESLKQDVRERAQAFQQQELESEQKSLRMRQLEAEMASKNKEIQEIKKKNQELQTPFEKLRTEFMLSKVANETLLKENEELRASLEQANVRVGDLTIEVEERDFRLDHMEREVDFFYKRNAELKTFYDVLREEKAIKDIQVSSFRNANATLEAKMEIHEPVYIELQKKNEDLLVENSALNRKAAMLKEQLERLEKDHETAKIDLGIKKGENDELKNEAKVANTGNAMAQSKLKGVELEKNTVKVENSSIKSSIEKQNQLLKSISNNFYASQAELERSKLLGNKSELRMSSRPAFEVQVQSPEKPDVKISQELSKSSRKVVRFREESEKEVKWRRKEIQEEDTRPKFTDMSGLIQEMRGSILALKGQIDKKENNLKLIT